ncbi:hypothetical protein CCHOA_04925 [Corynebacterium choanae]|uniref:Uncharacterized protein n=1 Tax=Corynebacterium choanae TaxID=1862358 RepID=A0A3G6J6K9_9CORY|nr:hypothetical protein CCHOA_04925 [Corynebacterium choanae]
MHWWHALKWAAPSKNDGTGRTVLAWRGRWLDALIAEGCGMFDTFVEYRWRRCATAHRGEDRKTTPAPVVFWFQSKHHWGRWALLLPLALVDRVVSAKGAAAGNTSQCKGDDFL